jgi:plastocyanin
MRSRMVVLAAVLAALALAAAGCGGSSNKSSSSGGSSSSSSSSTPSQPASGSGGAGSTIKLSADPGGALKFNTSTLSAKAGTVTIDFDNPSQTPHAVTVEGKGLEKASKTITGGKATLTVSLKKGTYEFYCPVDGHKQAGMKGTLTVS